MEGVRAGVYARLPTAWLERLEEVFVQVAWGLLLGPAIRIQRELDERAIEQEEARVRAGA